MDDGQTFSDDRHARAEEVRRRSTYRQLVLRGKLRVPLAAARKLLGPDTAYHLYQRHHGKSGDGV
jgi:hypothetical protein